MHHEFSHLKIEEIIPQDPPFVLIDEVLKFDEESIHACLTISEKDPFYLNGSVPAYVSLEYMAQTIAAWNGLRALQRGGAPKIGFLLGTRKLQMKVSQFTKDQHLDVRGGMVYSDGEIASFDCVVSCNEEKLVAATLTVYEPKENMMGNF